MLDCGTFQTFRKDLDGGGAMLELLVRLECKRQVLRGKLLGRLGLSGDRYHAMVGLILFLYFALIPVTIVVTPLAGIPFFSILAGLVVLGVLLLFTVMLAPVSLILF